MRVEDPRVRVVEARRLDAPLEQRLRLAHEELVERVLARDEHREAVAAAAGPAPLLAQRGDRAGEAHRDRAVELADVDSELERVRRRDAEELALHKPPLDLTPLRGRVAGAVGSEPRGGRGVDAVGGEAVDQLCRLAALREADRAQPARDEPRHQERRLARARSRERRAPGRASAGFQRTMSRSRPGATCRRRRRSPRGPVSASASSPGFAIVAEARRNCGSAP